MVKRRFSDEYKSRYFILHLTFCQPVPLSLFKMVLMLMEKKESTGTTILMEAVRRKRGDLVSLLLEQPDIQVNAKNKDNWTALHFAVQAQHSTKHNTKKMIRSLLNFPGINTEIVNDRGKTPLMMATRVNNKYFVKVYQKKMGEDKKHHPETQESFSRK